LVKTEDFSFLKHAQGYLTNIRALEWRAYLGMSILGYLQGTGSISLFINDPTFFLKYIITVMLYLAFSFAINNCYDYEGDQLGDKISKNPIASGQIGKNEGIAQSYIIAITGVILSYYWFDTNSFIIYIGMMLLSCAYSTPPFRLKSVPFLDLISHGLFAGFLIIFYGISVTQGFGENTVILLSSITIFSLILELRNHLEDYEEDLASKVNTTVAKIGVIWSNRILYGLLLIHFSFLIRITYIIGEFAAITMIIGLPLIMVLLLLLKKDKQHYLKSIDVLSTITCIAFVLIDII